MQFTQQSLTRTLRTAEDIPRLLALEPTVEPADILAAVTLIGAPVADPVVQRLRCQFLQHLIEQRGDRRSFGPLVAALKIVDPSVRAVLVAAMPRVNDPALHSLLTALLGHRDRGVRHAAAQILTRVGGKTALADITLMVADKAFPARILAAEVAVRVAGHHALPAIRAALGVADAAEKQRLVRLLGDETVMGRDRTGALALLGEMLCDPEPEVLAAATAAFGGLANEDEWFDFAAPALESPHMVVAVAALTGLRRWSSPRALDALRAKFRSGPKAMRLEVLAALEHIGSDGVVPLLVEAVSHRQLEVRTQAITVLDALGRSGRVNVVPTVLWLLRSADPETRRMAVEIARRTGSASTEVWPQLFVLLRDQDWWVRERVSDALLEIAGEQLLPFVMGFLADPESPVRLFGVEVIRKLRAEKALGALVKTAREDTDWWVRERAVEAVGVMGDPRAAPYLVELAQRDPALRVSAIRTLGAMRAVDMAPHVARFLDFADPGVRQAALLSLEELGARAQVAAVAPLVGDPDPSVALVARRLVLGWNMEVAVVSNLRGLDALCKRAADLGVDDLLLIPDRHALGKHSGRMQPLSDQVLSGEDIRSLLVGVLTPTHLQELDALRDVDLSYQVPGGGLRYRGNVFRQRAGLSAVFRVVKSSIPSLDDLGLPQSVRGLAELKNGLVLVGGPSCSGKSTTLAALIDRINATRSSHVITLEDPIEVVHPCKRGLVNQRELGSHASSYLSALRATLRQDPDVILVGELRDLETVAFAVSAAETGHLVLGTVHTLSVDTAVDRLIHAFPHDQQAQVRSQLAGTLRGAVCQLLLPRLDGGGRVLACEVMLSNDAVAQYIRAGKTHQLPSVIATGRDFGMQAMDTELLRLYKAGVISGETAYVKARNKKDFEAMLAASGSDAGRTGTAV